MVPAIGSLRALSRRIGEHEAALAALVESVARIDLALACGRLSRGWRGTPVEIAETVVLRGARHPLLDPTTAVPISRIRISPSASRV